MEFNSKFWRDDLDNREVMVSIKCITYNHEPYIRNALDSFLMQKTNFRFEVIVHDDASSDNTALIIQEYAQKYPSIIKPIYEKENLFTKGGFPLIDEVLKVYLRGKYIACCEGDDYWTDPLKLQKQFDLLQSNENIALSFHNARVINVGSGEEYDFVKNLSQGIIPYWRLILSSWLTPTASFFYRSSCLWELKQPNDINGDMFILFGCGVKGAIYYLNEISSVYRFGTTGSASDVILKSSPIPVYNKKIALMRFINNITNNRYVLFTGIKSLWCHFNILKCKFLGR